MLKHRLVNRRLTLTEYGAALDDISYRQYWPRTLAEFVATQAYSVIIIPTKAFARDYVITGVGLSVCLFVTMITK